jgi:hypothetical protein
VATSPITWETDPDLKKKANRQALFNLLEVGVGVALDLSGKNFYDSDGNYSISFNKYGGGYTLLGTMMPSSTTASLEIEWPTKPSNITRPSTRNSNGATLYYSESSNRKAPWKISRRAFLM